MAQSESGDMVGEMTEAQKLEMEIIEMSGRLAALRAAEPAEPVPDYEFQTLSGPTRLSGLFAGRDRLLVIQNMGEACRYCTVYADGVNGVLAHLEDAMAVALVSKDAPDVQRRMALSRGWRFRMASHGGGAYMKEQCKLAGYDNCPSAVVYEMSDGRIARRGRTAFCPGDLYSPLWPFLSLAGVGGDDWTPQFAYWSRPQKLEDGGEDVRD